MAGRRSGRPIAALPSALERWEEVAARVGDRTPALFLDYDGTLTPIVERPADATLPARTRDVLARAAGRVPVAVISGRDLSDVRRLVGLDALWYAGSHGFDIAGPGGRRERRAREALPALGEAEAELRRAVEASGDFPGARVERKEFAVAVHYRGAPRGRVPDLRRRVEEVAGSHAGLRTTGGKKVVELRPDVEWDKGRALRWLWGMMGLDGEIHHPFYLGDDVTDEDAFRVLAGGLAGTGVVVRGEEDRRPSRADYALADPDEVRRFLETLLPGAGPGR